MKKESNISKEVDIEIEEDKASPPKETVKEQKKDKMIRIKESELNKIKEECADFKDKHVRLYAEFENARKRMDRERIEFVKYANEGLIVEFLHVLDDLNRTVEAAKTKHEDYEAFLKGVEMVMKQIGQLLDKNGVQAIETKGKNFDPHLHEILLQEESDKVKEGTILEEFQRGYRLGDRVVRVSKVKVAKKKEGKEKDKE